VPDRIRIEAIEFVGPSRDYAALRRQVAALIAAAKDAQVGTWRVIVTDGPVAADQVDDVIAALRKAK